MKKLKKLLLAFLGVISFGLTSCGSNIVSEYNIENKIEENILYGELVHKDHNPWIDVWQVKPTTISYTIYEASSTKAEIKQAPSMNVYLRKSDTENLVEKEDFEDKNAVIKTNFDFEFVPILDEDGKEDYFPIVYGEKDCLAMKYKFNLAKFAEGAKSEEKVNRLFLLETKQQKYKDGVLSLVGTRDVTPLTLDEAGIYKVALQLQVSVDGNTEYAYVAQDGTLEYMKDYSNVLKSMFAYEEAGQKFAAYKLNEETKKYEFAQDVSLKETKFVDSAEDVEGSLNLHDATVKIMLKK